MPDERFRPYFRPGNLLIISPSAQVEEGDLVLAHIHSPVTTLAVHEVAGRESESLLVRSSTDASEVSPILNRDLDWYSRIVFSSF